MRELIAFTVLVSRKYSDETVVEGRQQTCTHDSCALTLQLDKKTVHRENSGQAVVNIQEPIVVTAYM